MRLAVAEAAADGVSALASAITRRTGGKTRRALGTWGATAVLATVGKSKLGYRIQGSPRARSSSALLRDAPFYFEPPASGRFRSAGPGYQIELRQSGNLLAGYSFRIETRFAGEP